MRVLLIGANSQLGRCILDRVPAEWSVISTTSKEVDITDSIQISHMIERYQPDAIINTAAYTAVDNAESAEDQAFLVNAVGVKNVALACEAAHIRLVHISTDYVFDGTADKPYQTTDIPNPLSVYGRSKLAGELLALAHSSQSQIIRTSWLYSEYGHNFVKAMIRLADEGREALSVVNDQIGSPTYAGNLAQAIIELLHQPISDRLLHYSDSDIMSWYEFAQNIFAYRERQGLSYCQVKPVPSTEYPTPVKRPVYSVLQSSINIKEKVSLYSVLDSL